MFKKKYINVYEMNAVKTKYDAPFKPKDFVMLSLIPALYMAGIFYISFYSIPVSLIAAGAGAFYSMAVFIPLKIRIDYERSALKMRNRFVGNLAQAINRQNATVLDVLKEMSDHRLDGELKREVEELVYKINSASPQQKHDAYHQFMERYSHDTIFVHFLEHLLTLDLQGKVDTSALDETAELHNKMLERHGRFVDKKSISILYYVINIGVGLFLVGLFQWLSSQMITWQGFQDAFVNSIVGVAFNSVFLFVTLYFNHKCVIAYSDESLMEGRL